MMLSGQHVYSHQQHAQAGEHTWSHLQQNQQGFQNSQHPQQQLHAQAQAVAAAAAANAAQQQHYNRIAVNQNRDRSDTHLSGTTAVGGRDHRGGTMSSAGGDTSQEALFGIEQSPNDEMRRVLGWCADLMDPVKRESALMELSKKREQVPELAMIIWHSFGKMACSPDTLYESNVTLRDHDLPYPGNHICLSSSQSVPINGRSIESCLQCPSLASMCSFTQ